MKQFQFESPNYTQTPNDLFDELLKEIDDLSELKVTLMAVRMTQGYHKESAELSVEYLQQATGLARNSVRRGLALALQRGTIRIVTKATNRTGGIYALNVRGSTDDMPEGQPVTPRGSAVAPLEGQPVTPLNKTLKKNRNKKISKEREILPESEKVPPKSPPPKHDPRFGVFVKEIERRTSHLTPRDYERLGELWDEHPDLKAHIYALEQLDQRGVGFNHVYYEKCLFSFEDGKARQKHGGYLKATVGDGDRERGNGTERRGSGTGGNGDAGAAQSAAGIAGP